MTLLDWSLVIAVNGAIIAYGLVRAKGTKSSVDWFLAAKGLPWWIVGLSMFATAVDSGDYVAVAGGSYQFGISMITQWWLGLTIAWLLAAYFIFLPMYRTGMYTNAEYLEYRFGPAARTLSVLIQIQYRTNVLGNVAYSLYLTFSILTGWGNDTWWLVGVIAAGAAVYTASGGLRSVAFTDALQSVAMFIAALVLWAMLWIVVGGWSGLELKLQEAEPQLAAQMLHVGGYTEPGVPAALIVFGWIIVLFAYCVVNHSQSMRMFAARSEWDMKMAAVAAGAITVLMMWFNITIGILGRGIFPDLQQGDEVFPKLVQEFLEPLGAGLVGIVVAGLLAGGVSTYDSIGSALAAVLTRDCYARFLVKTREDHHYLTVSRVLTCVVIASSFGYVPFLKEGMVAFYLDLTRVAVMPLFTVYLMGTLTRVHRRSGAVGLVAGIAFGAAAFLAGRLPGWTGHAWGGDGQPPLCFVVWTNKWWGYVWGMLVPAAAMVATSMICGWHRREDLGELVFSHRHQPGAAAAITGAGAARGTWLDSTHRAVPDMPATPFLPPTPLPWHKRPHLWAWLLAALVLYLNLVVLW